MTTSFAIKSLLASNTNVELDDSLTTKEALRRLGYYKTPSYGMTPYPDGQLFDALSNFQRDRGIRRTADMRPGDATEMVIRQELNKNTRKPADERKSGEYIWRTRGDSKVRSEHAGRDGKIFSWDEPPEGGHPGEAPNCRCRAEEAVEDNKFECARFKAQLEVDAANVETVREVYKNATRTLNQTIDTIERNSEERDQLMSQAVAEFGVVAFEVLTGRASPGKVAGLAVLAAQYSELELEYARLSDRHDELVVEQRFGLENMNEAKAIRAATQAKFDSLKCGNQ